MRDLNKMIEYVERQTYGRETRAANAADTPKPNRPTQRSWRAPDATLHLAERKAHANTLIARVVKLTISLQPAAVAALVVRDGEPRVKLIISYEGGTLRAEVAAKAVRRAQKTLAENGIENVFVALQGKLAPKNEIIEAGLVAQIKATTP